MSDFDTVFKQFKDNTKPMCDETALYQRDDDIYHILTEDKFV